VLITGTRYWCLRLGLVYWNETLAIGCATGGLNLADSVPKVPFRPAQTRGISSLTWRYKQGLILRATELSPFCSRDALVVVDFLIGRVVANSKGLWVCFARDYNGRIHLYYRNDQVLRQEQGQEIHRTI
jgi:hypothetical protein